MWLVLYGCLGRKGLWLIYGCCVFVRMILSCYIEIALEIFYCRYKMCLLPWVVIC